MSRIEISCFGNLRVEVDGQPINHFDTDKTRALLVYLAIENKYPQPRSHLAGLLWSDQPEDQALHSLRQALSSLRRTLGDAQMAHPILLIERETVKLNPQITLWVDVQAFQSSLAAAYRYYQSRDQGGWINIRRLTAALALRQEPFLTHLRLKGGPLFDEWQTLTRENLDQHALQGLALLSEVYEKRGEYALARQTAQRRIDIAPWDEEAHAQLMRLFALDGQRSAAQNQYRTLRRFLHEQLGVEPADETTALFEQVRAAGDEPPPALLRFPRDPSNIPDFFTPFIGREQELDEVTDLLVNPTCRELTLLGPGGIGKTRLALEAARQQVGALADGVFYVPMTTVRSAEQLTAAIADALGLILADQSDPGNRLLDYLREKRMLLVLDNFEQLLDKPENLQPVIDILNQASGVTLLVTSRERLMLKEEWVYSLAGLRFPQSFQAGEMHAEPEWIEQYDALRLFYQRAHQVQHGYPLDGASLPYAVRICQLLEGLPLGVELAAAALWNHPINVVIEKIRQHLNAFSATAVNVSPRHRSLWAAFEVSWQLLTAEEQALFCRVGIFQGGFIIDAAKQVANAEPDLLAALVNQSLLRLEPNGRYGMHEAVRQYAMEKLTQSGCMDEVRPGHARYYSAFLASRSRALYTHEQKSVLADIHSEISNIATAWNWLVETRDISAISACINPLYEYYNIRSRFNEGIQLFQPAARIFEDMVRIGMAQEVEEVLGMLLSRIGSLAYYARQNALAHRSLEQAMEIFTRRNNLEELALCRTSLGGVYLRAKDFSQALACAEQNLAYYRQMGNLHGESRALYLFGLIYNRQGKINEAKPYLTTAVEMGRKDIDPRRLTAPLNMLGDIACVEGDYVQAEALFQESLKNARGLHDLFYQAIILNNLASVYHINHQLDLARKTYQESLAICKDIGDRDGEAVALNNLGELAVLEGNYAQAAIFSERALKIARQIGEEWTIAICLNNLGETSNGAGKPDQASYYLAEAIRVAWEIEAMDMVARFSVNAGRAFQLLGSQQEAADLYRAVLSHTAAEHEARVKAAAWLSEMKLDSQAAQNNQILIEAVARLFLSGGEDNANTSQSR